jgi:tetratricopeptide (TPR) repeat protein
MPDTFGVDLLRAQSQLRRGRVDEGVQSLTDLFLRSPSSTLALQLADRYAAAGQLDEARSWYVEALHLQPTSPEAMAGVVRTEQLLGEAEQAMDLADQYLLVYPDHVQLVLIRAELEIAGGRPDLALADASWAVWREPRWPWALAVQAQALWELGRPDESLDALAEALRVAPTDMALRVRLAENLLEVGRNAEAVRIAQPVARLFPDDEAAAGLLARATAALASERAR